MPTITLKTEIQEKSRAHRAARVLFFLLLVLGCTLLVERWRGQWALRAWQQKMIAQGEVFDPVALWPKPNPQHLAFSNQLSQAVQQLPKELTVFAGAISGIVLDESYQARRGSQEPLPQISSTENTTNTWAQLDAAIRQGKPALEDLRALMKHPPRSMGDDIVSRFKEDRFRYYFGGRVGAHALHALAMHHLHVGDLSKALEDLEALSAFTQYYADEPTLVSYMIRIALSGLAADVCWDALQAPGWTDGQLMRLQQASQIRPLLDQLPQVKRAEAVGHTYLLQAFRSLSYDEWLARYAPVYKSLGMNLPQWRTAPLERGWQQWGFHPLWSFAWADLEQLHYLQHQQVQIEAMREAVSLRSWHTLNLRYTEIMADYRPPHARWRFYFSLPLLGDLATADSRSRPAEPAYPFPDFQRAWQYTFKNLVLNEMVTTAIALQRYQRRHGKLPTGLDALVPEFLAEKPVDLMDGQPLRYRLKPDGSFILYSVGTDGRDDGGDPIPDTDPGYGRRDPWSGRDWVWMQCAPDARRRLALGGEK